jgi:hypothetical protein
VVEAWGYYIAFTCYCKSFDREFLIHELIIACVTNAERVSCLFQQLYIAPVTNVERYAECIDFWRDVYGIDSKD